jgi:putative DNA primase/helicase
VKQRKQKAAVFEIDVAERLIQEHGQRLRYVTGIGWLVWVGTHWQRDEQDRSRETVKELLAQLRTEAAVLKDDDLWSLCKSVSTARGITSVLKLAESDPRIRLTVRDLDAHPHLLACRNGTVNLKTGDLSPADPGHLLTSCCPTDYNPEARHGGFLRLLEHLFPDKEARSYLQRVAGYSLTGKPTEDVIVLVIGAKRAGKGTFLRAVSESVGEHYTAAQMESFCTDGRRRGGDRARSDLFRLVGRRIVGASEISPGQLFDTGKLKALAGGDPMPVRTLNKPEIVAPVTFTLWLIANDGDLPRIRPEDEAMWERVRRIPIGGTVPEKDRDPAFRESMADEDCKAAVLAWMAEGAMTWYQDGKLGSPPDCIIEAGRQLKEQMDEIGPFVRERIEFVTDHVTPKKKVYEAIERWFDGEKPPSKQRIAAAIRIAADKVGADVSTESYDRATKSRAFKGLKLKEAA